MSHKWEYPIYLCRHEGGFASVGHDKIDEGQYSAFAITVFTSIENVEKFIAAAEIEGEPMDVADEQSFVRFLRRLQPPFSFVAFDPVPDATGSHATWTVAVETLLLEHLSLSRSPWEYPLYALAGADDWQMIEGSRGEDEDLFLLCLFCSPQTASAYAHALEKELTTQEIETPEALRLLLSGLLPAVTAVAFDPAIAEDGHPVAGTCMSSDTILEKYIPE